MSKPKKTKRQDVVSGIKIHAFLCDLVFQVECTECGSRLNATIYQDKIEVDPCKCCMKYERDQAVKENW